MATYYVRPDGNDGNTGLGSTTLAAWKTLQKALSATGIASGDIVYVAPGRYNESVTVAMTSATVTTRIVGNPTASQFSGVSAGEVLWTGLTSSGIKAITTLLLMTSKNYLSFENIHFEAPSSGGVTASINCTTCTNTSFVRCQFTEPNLGNGHVLIITSPSGQALNFTLDSCHIFYNKNSSSRGFNITGQNVSDNSVVQNCIVMCHQANSIGITNLQCKVYNNTFIGSGTGFENQGGSASFQSTVRNNLFIGCIYGLYSATTSTVVEDYNRYIGVTNTFSNAVSGGNSSTLGGFGIFGSYALQQGLVFGQMLGTNQSSPNASFGNATGAPTTDMFGIAWSGTSPDAGSTTLRSIGAIGNYLPTERNASAITIAPASTSQSIELYLGATGLTASTSGLTARYNRTRTASVSIPLVARTIAQAWTAGGFAEVDATNMPGVYRLDVPDAAFAAGASDVTIVVRGASGTNGAVLTVTLSSGGLTAAQTASAVWGASVAGYVAETDFGGVVNATRNVVGGMETQLLETPAAVWDSLTDNHGTHGTFGWGVLRADQDSKQGLVTLHSSGGVNRVDSDVHAIQNDTAAATELKGALLHNGTDYISADLLVPVTSATTLRMGPYLVKPDGGGANGALEINQGTAGNIVVQLVDATGAGINQTASTVQAKVYNAGGTLVATYTCTAEYATDGWLAIPLTTTVSGTSGTYTVTLWSTVGATVTVYGPLSMRVRAI